MLRWLCGWAVVLSLAAGVARAAPPVETYGKLPGIEDVALSPSGAAYAFVTLVGDKRMLVVLASNGALLAKADVGKTKVRSVRWVGEDHVLVDYSATVTLGMDFTVWRHELSGVLSINVRTKKETVIFGDTQAIAHTVLGQYGQSMQDGHWYGYFGGVTYQTELGEPQPRLPSGALFPDLYRVDLDTGESRLAAHGSEITQGWLVGPDGAVIARQTYDEKSGQWEVRAGVFGGKLLAQGHSAFGGAGLARGRTPDSVLIAVPEEDHNGVGYKEVSLSTGAATDVPDSDEIAQTLHDPETGLWIGVVKTGDRPQAELFDPTLEARAKGTAKAFPDLSVSLIGFSRDLTHLVVFTSGSGDPGTYWTVDIAAGAANPFGYPYPSLHTADVGPIRMVDWKAADGLALRGVLSLPPNAPTKPLPLVVMPHGGPEDRDYPTFDWWAQAFASQGYAVFQPNFRGSDGYGVKFRNAGFGEWGRKMQTDISDGVAELAREGLVDPRRACIVGASYGGYAALAGVLLQHGLYRCAVAVAGVSDLAAMTGYVRDQEGDQPGASMRYWRAFMGEHADQVSPISFASHADAPILLIHGKDDTVVPFSQSQAMTAALKAAGKPVELVVLPGEDHWLSREETRVMMLKAAVAFVEKHDPPQP
jgi:dipeptidyl aminopeptidase/acylaminoacyl peptidase